MNGEFDFVVMEEQAFKLQIEKNLWGYHFVKEILKSEFDRRQAPAPLTCGYFDSDGVLLVLCGEKEYIKKLKQEGIVEGSVWTRKQTGRNAVTVCLEEERRQMFTYGDGNAPDCLKRFCIYFSRLYLLDVDLKNYYNKELKLGGIAFFTDLTEDRRLVECLLRITIHDVGMTLNCDLQLRRQYERNKNGVLFLNSSMEDGKITATYVNERFFRIFSSEPKTMQFASLECFFSRTENGQLWEILQKKKYVENKQILLKFRGNAVICLITTDFWNQPGLRTTGCILSITTPQIENRKISKQIANNAVVSMDNIIGSSLILDNAKHKALMFASTDSNVMLLGESGVGKDVFAQAIHNASRRKDKPFIAINCGAMPRELIASELFGYERGAFTGAKQNGNIGKFELADGGTIFLDEIGELPLDLQATLLRLVEQKQFMRIGGNQMIHADVKIICATNANLPEMIEKKLFRADLFYRLGILTLQIPPLRERGDDIVELAEYFVKKISQRIGREDIMRISEPAKRLLKMQVWHGNVRELQNMMELIVQLYAEPEILPEYICDNFDVWTEDKPLPDMAQAGKKEAEQVHLYPVRIRKEVTREDIEHALEICNGKREETAKLLGISRKTLYRYMKQYALIK